MERQFWSRRWHRSLGRLFAKMTPAYGFDFSVFGERRPEYAAALRTPAQELSRNRVALFKRSLFAVWTMFAIRNKLHRCLWQHVSDALHFAGLGSRIEASMQE